MNKLVLALAAAMVAISIVAANLWLQLHEVRAQTTQLRERVTGLQSAQLANDMAPGVPAAAVPVPGIPGAQATSQAPTAVPGAAGASDDRESALLDRMNQIFATPEGREMLRAQARMTLPSQYPDLAKELRLTPAEEEKFFDLLARQQTDRTANTLGAVTGGTPDRAAVQEMQRKAQEQQRADEAELTAMLGSKYPQYQEYQKALPSRRQVTQLQSTLSAGNNALTDSQSKPLIAALAAEQTRIQEDRRNEPRVPEPVPTAGNRPSSLDQQLQRTAEVNRRLVSVAAGHLNPQQLESYRRMLEQEESMQRTMLRSITLPASAGDRAAPAAPGTPR